MSDLDRRTIVFCFTSRLLSDPGVVGFGVEVWRNYFRSLWKLATTVCTEDVARVVRHAAPAAEKLEKLACGGRRVCVCVGGGGGGGGPLQVDTE